MVVVVLVVVVVVVKAAGGGVVFVVVVVAMLVVVAATCRDGTSVRASVPAGDLASMEGLCWWLWDVKCYGYGCDWIKDASDGSENVGEV